MTTGLRPGFLIMSCGSRNDTVVVRSHDNGGWDLNPRLDGLRGGQTQKHSATTWANSKGSVVGARDSIGPRFIPNLIPSKSTMDDW
jgi:hypothetical protein